MSVLRRNSPDSSVCNQSQPSRTSGRLPVWLALTALLGVLGACSDGTADKDPTGAGDAGLDILFPDLSFGGTDSLQLPDQTGGSDQVAVTDAAQDTDNNAESDGTAPTDTQADTDTAQESDIAAESDSQTETDTGAETDTQDESDVAAETDSAMVTDASADTDATAASDDAELSDAVTADAADDVPVVPGVFGDPCVNNAQCASGYCVESPAGKICSQTCKGTCPVGFQCAAPPGSTGEIYVCFSKFARLCDPCKDNGDCNAPGAVANRCLTNGEGSNGSFCGVACQLGKDGQCPDGYQCVPGQVGGPQCSPIGGTCSCSPAAIAKGLTTPCSVTGNPGTCKGIRSCTPTGLSTCNAPTPALEVCNEVDDNCNGQVDDLIPLACSETNEFGTCNGVANSCTDGLPFCNAKVPAVEVCNLLDDDCDGATDEGLCDDGNSCTYGFCKADGSCQQTNLAAACNDDNVCTEGDECVEGACVSGGPSDCADNDPCTIDSCQPKVGCVHLPSDGSCTTDGDPCTDDRCINNVCQHPISAVGTPCPDDGNLCSLDQCNGGTCLHPPVPQGTVCPDDGIPCTTDVCDGTSALICTHTASVEGAACPDDGESCTLDTCDATGNCLHTLQTTVCSVNGVCYGAGDGPPDQPCLVCDPTETQTSLVPVPNKACDDGNNCTSNDKCDSNGTCQGGAKDCSDLSGPCATGTCNGSDGSCIALGKPADTQCTDDNPCTTGDKCQDGQCVAKVIDCSVLNSQCQNGVCSGGICIAEFKTIGTPCDDGSACSVEDKCNSNGGCTSVPKDCSSLTSTCGNGVCQAGSCAVIPVSNGVQCNDGDQCTFNDTCAAGYCKGTAPKDGYEPNDNAPGVSIGSKSDCDESSSKLTATLSPSGDVDWFNYSMSDDFFCSIYPTVRLTALKADYDVCAYFLCNGASQGNSSMLSCTQGTLVSGGPNGTWGCCSSNPGTSGETVELNTECSFLALGDDGGTMYVRTTKKNSAQACDSYGLGYGANTAP